GRSGEAESLLREALKIMEEINADAWQRFEGQSMLGGALIAQHRYSDAETLAISAYQGLAQRWAAIPWESRSVLDGAVQRIIELYRSWGKLPEAAEWRQRLQSDNAR